MNKFISAPIKQEHGSVGSYTYGFIYSILLTLTAYIVVTHHLFSNTVGLLVIVGLAFAQLIVQLLFFLHLGRETKPRWKLGFFIFTIIIVTIMVGGSLWIMKHLTHYNHLAKPNETSEHFIIRDEGLKK